MAISHGADPTGKSVMPALRPIVMGRRGMVVAGHYLAAQAGLRVLQMGGNAVDAGVAAGLVINVVHNDMAGFGGVAPAIVKMAGSSRVTSISGIGRWPAAMSQELLDREHGGKLPKSALRWVTPAAPDTWLTSLARFGTLPFAEVVKDALYHAEHGYPVHYFQAANIADQADAYAAAPHAGAVYAPGGRTVAAGTVVHQPDLARTFRRLIAIEERLSGFGRAAALAAARNDVYQGDIARELAEHSRRMGGVLTFEDLAGFSVGLEDAVATTYRGHTLYSCGPWSQGPTLPMALNILERFDLRALGWNTAPYLHTVVEALKLAFMDRERWVGDPEFTQVPLQALVSKEYAALRATLIDPRQAWRTAPPPGDPIHMRATSKPPSWLPQAEPRPGEPEIPGQKDWTLDTSFVSAVDAEGNIFCATPSDATLDWAPGLGFGISERGSQVFLHPESPNSLLPGKRPRLTPNPTLILKDGVPAFALGTPGNDRQPQAMAQALLNIVEFGMPAQAAVEAPRLASFSFPATTYPNAYYPGDLYCEEGIPDAVRRELAAMGHNVKLWPNLTWKAGGLCVIQCDPNSGVLSAGADPRRETYAAGY